jgi:hypothetical protein
LVWSLQLALEDLGIAAAESSGGGFLYEVAFVTAALAGALGLAVLGRQRWIWSQLSALERAAAELAFLLAGGTLWLALAWAPAVLQGNEPRLALALVALLEVAAFAQLLSRLPYRAGQPAALILCVWWLPALGRGAGGALGELSSWLAGPAAALTPPAAPITTLRAVDMAPAVASGLAAWLLTPKIPRP